MNNPTMNTLNEHIHKIIAEEFKKLGIKAKLCHNANGERIIRIEDELNTTIMLTANITDDKDQQRTSQIPEAAKSVIYPNWH